MNNKEMLNYGTLVLKNADEQQDGKCIVAECEIDIANKQYNVCTKHYRHLPHIKEQNRKYDKKYCAENSEKRTATAKAFYLKKKAAQLQEANQMAA